MVRCHLAIFIYQFNNIFKLIYFIKFSKKQCFILILREVIFKVLMYIFDIRVLLSPKPLESSHMIFLEHSFTSI